VAASRGKQTRCRCGRTGRGRVYRDQWRHWNRRRADVTPQAADPVFIAQRPAYPALFLHLKRLSPWPPTRWAGGPASIDLRRHMICYNYYMSDTSVHWLLLVHQLPPKHDALRVRIWRRLQAIGSVAIKNACWCLPDTPASREDFQWCVQEITAGGGEALICASRLVEGMTNDQVVALFKAARDADYAALVADIRAVADGAPDGDREALVRQAGRLRKQFDAILAIDHGAAPGRAAAQTAITRLARLVMADGKGHRPVIGDLPTMASMRGKTWVTRADVGIDRLASAWLVRRFIDPKARFRFVAGANAARRRGEVRFDMFEAEFTHQGDLCTFEVLLGWCGRADQGLKAIADIVHDLDLKDDRHQHPATAGLSCAVTGIATLIPGDAERIARGCALFDLLYAGLNAQIPPARKGARP
jgi:hypothetical protein